MNDLNLCLEVVWRSRRPLRYIWRWISRKPLEIEVWFQRTTNRKWHMGYRMVTSPMPSRDPERSNLWPQCIQSAISRKLLELETSNLVCSFVSGMPSGRTNNFPWNWAWPRSRDPTIFGIRSNISQKLLELETSNLVGGFVLGMPSRRTNNFPEGGRGLGHVTSTIFGSTVGYPSDSLASSLLCTQQSALHVCTFYLVAWWWWLVATT